MVDGAFNAWDKVFLRLLSHLTHSSSVLTLLHITHSLFLLLFKQK